MRYFAGTLPIAPNHCGHHDPIQMKSPAVTGYHELSSREMPPPSNIMRPCSITCISTMLSAAPGWYTIVLTAKSKLISSGSKHLTCRSGSFSKGCEETASSLDTIGGGG